MWKSIVARIDALYVWAGKLPIVGVLIRAGGKGQKGHDKDMAASIAYYTFLSLFPLLLGLIALGGFFLKSAEIQLRVNSLIVELLPVSGDLVTKNIESLIRIRGAAGLTGAAVLLWSGSKMVGALSRAINRSLGLKRPYAIYLSSLRSFGLTILVALIVFLTMAVTPILELLADLQLDVVGERWNSFLNIIAGRTASLLLTGIMVAALYAFIPYQRLPWRTLFPGVIVASVLIEVGKELFAFYVGTVSRYNTLYGSVSSVIVLLLWLYFSARVVLYGADVISVVSESRQRKS